MGAMKHDPTYQATLATQADTDALAAKLAPLLEPGDVILLSGDLGAGKTRFVQGVARALGISGEVSSPTFNILLTYDEGRLPLNHFDLYRLDAPEDLEDVGYWETLEGDGASFVEWGEKFPSEAPDDYVDVHIAVDPAGVRTLTAHAVGGPRSARLLSDWLA